MPIVYKKSVLFAIQKRPRKTEKGGGFKDSDVWIVVDNLNQKEEATN